MLRSVWSVVLLVVLSILAGCGGAAPAPAPTVTTAPKAAPTTAPAAPPTTAPTAAPKAANTTAPTTAPTAASKAAATTAPTAASKAAATTAPTAASKAAAPTAPAPAGKASSADVLFGWAPGSVPPADADDTAIIIQKLQTNNGIIGATGDETGMTVSYNPSLITVEKIIEIFGNMGHPVVKK